MPTDKWHKFIEQDTGFGHVRWQDGDIQSAAQEHLGRELTAEEMETVKDSYAVNHITDRMIETGWECIRLALEEL